jgi:hypothetical protein
MPARVHSRSPEEGIGLMRSVLCRGRGVATAASGVRGDEFQPNQLLADLRSVAQPHTTKETR